jgi:hypothetical protein
MRKIIIGVALVAGAITGTACQRSSAVWVQVKPTKTTTPVTTSVPTVCTNSWPDWNCK